MLLLATQALPTMIEYRHPNLGRLLQPRHYDSARKTHDAGFVWAADNDAYNGWTQESEDAFVTMIDTIAHVPGCKFCVCPDIVGEAGLTNMLYEEWAPQLWARGLPPAYVLQDRGPEYECWTTDDDAEDSDRWIPWGSMGALFIGSTTDELRGGVEYERIVREAKRRNIWVHYGRVNSLRRMRYAAEIGCDSVDGTQWVKWRARYQNWGLAELERLQSASQQRLEL